MVALNKQMKITVPALAGLMASTQNVQEQRFLNRKMVPGKETQPSTDMQPPQFQEFQPPQGEEQEMQPPQFNEFQPPQGVEQEFDMQPPQFNEFQPRQGEEQDLFNDYEGTPVDLPKDLNKKSTVQNLDTVNLKEEYNLDASTSSDASESERYDQAKEKPSVTMKTATPMNGKGKPRSLSDTNYLYQNKSKQTLQKWSKNAEYVAQYEAQQQQMQESEDPQVKAEVRRRENEKIALNSAFVLMTVLAALLLSSYDFKEQIQYFSVVALFVAYFVNFTIGERDWAVYSCLLFFYAVIFFLVQLVKELKC